MNPMERFDRAITMFAIAVVLFAIVVTLRLVIG